MIDAASKAIWIKVDDAASKATRALVAANAAGKVLKALAMVDAASKTIKPLLKAGAVSKVLRAWEIEAAS